MGLHIGTAITTTVTANLPGVVFSPLLFWQWRLKQRGLMSAPGPPFRHLRAPDHRRELQLAAPMRAMLPLHGGDAT
jgi:hypothetical protein